MHFSLLRYVMCWPFICCGLWVPKWCSSLLYWIILRCDGLSPIGEGSLDSKLCLAWYSLRFFAIVLNLLQSASWNIPKYFPGIFPYQWACPFSKSFVFLMISVAILNSYLSDYWFFAAFADIQISSIFVKTVLNGSVRV